MSHHRGCDLDTGRCPVGQTASLPERYPVELVCLLFYLYGGLYYASNCPFVNCFLWQGPLHRAAWRWPRHVNLTHSGPLVTFCFVSCLLCLTFCPFPTASSDCDFVFPGLPAFLLSGRRRRAAAGPLGEHCVTAAPPSATRGRRRANQLAPRGSGAEPANVVMARRPRGSRG